MKLPNHEKAVVRRGKIVDYLLSRVHKDGHAKAEFFESFGFYAAQWEILSEALKRHVAENEVKKSETSPFGMRYIIDGELETPDGRRPAVRAVWFIEHGSDTPYLATAYPGKEKRK